MSNLTTGRIPAGRKRLIEKAYLPMLAASGLSMALLNVFHTETVAVAGACRSLIHQDVL